MKRKFVILDGIAFLGWVRVGGGGGGGERRGLKTDFVRQVDKESLSQPSNAYFNFHRFPVCYPMYHEVRLVL